MSITLKEAMMLSYESIHLMLSLAIYILDIVQFLF